MDYLVEKVVINNVQHVCIVDNHGTPVTSNETINWANAYISKEKGHNTISSRETESVHLLFGLDFFFSQKIDLTERVSTGAFLTQAEVSDFSRHCFKKSADIKRDSHSHGKVVSFSSKDILSPAYKAATFREKSVANGTVSARMNSIKNFITYLNKRLHNQVNDSDLTINYNNTHRALSLEVKKLKRLNTKLIDIDKPIFDDDVIKNISEITTPDDISNPFRSRTQLRNQLIINLLFYTGMRRGALLQLKTTDLRDENIEHIVIQNRVNDDDPRYHRPTQKTQSGVAPIDTALMNELKFYINNIRSTYPASENHDYIFISESGKTSGQPLSKTGFDYIFSVLSNALSKKTNRNIKITPHMIRHYWNLDFSEKAEKAGMSHNETESLRKTIMTWSIKSNSGEVYNIVHKLKSVRRIKQIIQDRICNDE